MMVPNRLGDSKRWMGLQGTLTIQLFESSSHPGYWWVEVVGFGSGDSMSKPILAAGLGVALGFLRVDGSKPVRWWACAGAAVAKSPFRSAA